MWVLQHLEVGNAVVMRVVRQGRFCEIASYLHFMRMVRLVYLLDSDHLAVLPPDRNDNLSVLTPISIQSLPDSKSTHHKSHSVFA